MRSSLLLLLASCALSSEASLAQSLVQGVGLYRDNRSLSRERVNLGLSAEATHASSMLSASTYGLKLTRDILHGAGLGLAVGQESPERIVSDAIALETSQTWGKLTETRATIGWAEEGTTRALQAGIGVSRWIYHETLRISLDHAVDQVNGEPVRYLDSDFEQIDRPARIDQSGTTLALRHLATPTTIVDYTYGRSWQVNRPKTDLYRVGVKQFVTAADGAVHLTATRYDNRGRVSRQTVYGEKQGWEGNVAWLQTLWTDATGQIAYRYYREDETTRAYRDELTFGSDTTSVGIKQRLSKTGPNDRPLELTAKLSRYRTNEALTANIVELGLISEL